MVLTGERDGFGGLAHRLDFGDKVREKVENPDIHGANIIILSRFFSLKEAGQAARWARCWAWPIHG